MMAGREGRKKEEEGRTIRTNTAPRNNNKANFERRGE